MFSVYNLPNQIPGEKVLQVIRKDFFILLKKIFFFGLLFLLPLAFFYLMLNLFPDLLNNQLTNALVVLGVSFYYLFIWLLFFFAFIDYYLDVWIITTERIIDIEQRGFFSRVIAEQKLFRVQDVKSEVNGIFPTLLRFGTVHIQTAGTKQWFDFENIPTPELVRDRIIKLARRKKNEYKEKQNHEEEAS